MKGNPAGPGGSLTSKPTWSNPSGVFDHVGFLLLRAAKWPQPLMHQSKWRIWSQTVVALLGVPPRSVIFLLQNPG